MSEQAADQVEWEFAEVTSPRLPEPVPVIVARNVSYLPAGNRLQNLSIYLPRASETTALVGTPVRAMPGSGVHSVLPRWLVHIHGGAWRDPELTATSIEATVAHAFSVPGGSLPITAIASINYTVSQFPSDPKQPYDAAQQEHSDPAREAVHPRHVEDVLHGLALLRSYGLTDGSYILSGHSCGACLAFQAILQSPQRYGLDGVGDAPCPAAIIGLNGLYDLPELVMGLDAAHEHLRNDYQSLLTNAFGPNRDTWATASPTRFDGREIATRLRDGRVPALVVMDESAEDQLVPMNQLERLEKALSEIDGMRVVRGHRCTGKHAAPWEQGEMIWDSITDTLDLLRS